MFDGVKVLDVHAHVSAPMGGVGYLNRLLQATNGVMASPINTPAAPQFGLADADFVRSVDAHLAYIDERQIVGVAPDRCNSLRAIVCHIDLVSIQLKNRLDGIGSFLVIVDDKNPPMYGGCFGLLCCLHLK